MKLTLSGQVFRSGDACPLRLSAELAFGCHDFAPQRASTSEANNLDLIDHRLDGVPFNSPGFPADVPPDLARDRSPRATAVVPLAMLRTCCGPVAAHRVDGVGPGFHFPRRRGHRLTAELAGLVPTSRGERA